MKKAFWFTLGILLLAIAYAGLILPGIPWSTPAVGAAYCFAKSSDRFHAWIYNHKVFGPFLRNWSEKRVFPTKMKYMMLATMTTTLLFLWLTTGNFVAVAWSACFMILVSIWGWRYPGSLEEHDRRVSEGKRVAWLK
jgi:uncharacterized membrane protein YbaN (DUF454 family)